MPKPRPSDLSFEQLATSSIWQSRITLIVVIGGALVASTLPGCLTMRRGSTRALA